MQDETDLEFEENDEEGNEGQLADKLKKLREALKKANEEKQEYLTASQRLKADFVNLTRRTEEERATLILRANEALVEDLLPVLDSLDVALLNAPQGTWRDGLERIFTQLVSVLRTKGLRIIDEIGVEADPRIHESIKIVPSTEEVSSNKVAEVLQKGYMLGDHVIRAAKVAVAE